MPLKIAIQDDYVRQPNGEAQSFSARWKELAQSQGIDVQSVDVFKEGALGHIRGCDGFMWRYGFGRTDLAAAKRLLPAIEYGMQVPVFPNWRTSWHFEDKITQLYLLQAAGIPAPDTWVFWRREDALEFCRSASYPFVAKLAAGIRSNNVILVRDREQAVSLVERMFGAGIETMYPPPLSLKRRVGRNSLIRRLRGRAPERVRPSWDYFYAQEFLPDNAYDTRVTVIGKRAFAFRRFNREDDFRASGSGRISWDPEAIDLPTVRLAFDVATKLGTQSVAIDGMRRGETRLVGEISYTYAAWAIARCPGHWLLQASGDLRWIHSPMRAEDAIFEDFVHTIGAG